MVLVTWFIDSCFLCFPRSVDQLDMSTWCIGEPTVNLFGQIVLAEWEESC